MCVCVRRKCRLGAAVGKVKVKVTESCLTLCDRMDYTVHGVLQARILEWVAFPFSRGFSQGLNPGLPHWRRILYQLSHKQLVWEASNALPRC